VVVGAASMATLQETVEGLYAQELADTHDEREAARCLSQLSVHVIDHTQEYTRPSHEDPPTAKCQ
jgi:hypothetical protein